MNEAYLVVSHLFGSFFYSTNGVFHALYIRVEKCDGSAIPLILSGGN